MAGNGIVEWVVDRAKEMSTWLGLIGLAAAGGLYISPEMQDAIVQAGLAVAGLVAVVFREKRAR